MRAGTQKIHLTKYLQRGIIVFSGRLPLQWPQTPRPVCQAFFYRQNAQKEPIQALFVLVGGALSA